MGLKNGSDDEHRYQLCKDEYCERFPCRVYKEGYRNGFEDGFAEGYGAGFWMGYLVRHAVQLNRKRKEDHAQAILARILGPERTRSDA